jgi:hypothetical protein
VLAALEEARRETNSPPNSLSAALKVVSVDLYNPTSVPLKEESGVPAAPVKYESIDAVPEDIIREELQRSLLGNGATDADDLIQGVAHLLGFMRTGSRIQARIEEQIERLIQAGRVSRLADGRLRVSKT